MTRASGAARASRSGRARRRLAKKAAVNFDCSASPSARPIASSQRLWPVRQSSTRAARPRVQNTTSGASGVTNKAPMATSGMAIHISAASAAFSAEPNRRHAMKRDQRRHRANQKERKRPHPKFACAEQRSRDADEEGDHRRMVEIAKGKRARPERVIGFVESQLETLRGQRLHGQKRDRGDAGGKREPGGAARRRLSPRGGGGRGIAAHVVAFALIAISNPSRPSVARQRASRQSSPASESQRATIGKLTRRCCAPHTGASPPTSYSPR